jgi:hypothetical protein
MSLVTKILLQILIVNTCFFSNDSVYGVSLGLGSLNHFHSSFVMMFMLDPPSNRTSLTKFLPT